MATVDRVKMIKYAVARGTLIRVNSTCVVLGQEEENLRTHSHAQLALFILVTNYGTLINGVFRLILEIFLNFFWLLGS